jgi:hypothetical protein
MNDEGGGPPGRVGQMVIAGIPVMVTMGLRLTIAYLRFKRKAKKAARIFERELLAGGIDREGARKLTEMYLESSRVFHMGMKGAMGKGPARWRGRVAAARR